ncbi:MAG: hypothetical protein FJ276_14480 [Planctomycetes bacterium]|nr:hypothetical protein [Planctomycetota bacterium]
MTRTGSRCRYGETNALKVLPFAALLSEKQLQRFKIKARAAATMHHPNIVPVYAVGSTRGVYFHAAKLVNSKNLAEVLRELKALNQPADYAATSDAASESVQSLFTGTCHADWLTTTATRDGSPPRRRCEAEREPLHFFLLHRRGGKGLRALNFNAGTIRSPTPTGRKTHISARVG